jgi:hypothetical protein
VCGLLAYDNKWKSTLDEGIHMQTGCQLCQLLITVIAFNQPSQPAQLWDLYKQHLCTDLPHYLAQQHQLHLNEDMVFDYGFYLVQIIFSKMTSQWTQLVYLTHNTIGQPLSPLTNLLVLKFLIKLKNLPHLNDEQLLALC